MSRLATCESIGARSTAPRSSSPRTYTHEPLRHGKPPRAAGCGRRELRWLRGGADVDRGHRQAGARGEVADDA